MPALEFRNQTIQVDEDGYLIHEKDWSKELAEHLASLEGIRLTEDHWWVLNHIRDYYHENGFLPTIRPVVNAIRRSGFPPEKGRDKYLFSLFPRTPIRSACKIAGLHHPPPGFVCL